MKKFSVLLAALALATSSFGGQAAKHAKRPMKAVKSARAAKGRQKLNPIKIAPSKSVPHRLPKHGAD